MPRPHLSSTVRTFHLPTLDDQDRYVKPGATIRVEERFRDRFDLRPDAPSDLVVIIGGIRVPLIGRGAVVGQGGASGDLTLTLPWLNLDIEQTWAAPADITKTAAEQ